MPEETLRLSDRFWSMINDIRNDPVPLTNWPAHQCDQCTVNSAIGVMDLMAEHGCQYLDAFGLWATRAYPVDIVSAFQDSQRKPLLDKLCKAADQRFWDIWKIPPRCEWKLNDALFGTSPDPAMYLLELYLTPEGRKSYKASLVSALATVDDIRHDFEDEGRIERMRRCLIMSRHLLNTVMAAKGEGGWN